MEIDRSIDRWSVDVGVVRARAPPFLCRGVLQVGLGLSPAAIAMGWTSPCARGFEIWGRFRFGLEREERPYVN